MKMHGENNIQFTSDISLLYTFLVFINDCLTVEVLRYDSAAKHAAQKSAHLNIKAFRLILLNYYLTVQSLCYHLCSETGSPEV
jgi:hypothetical protein